MHSVFIEDIQAYMYVFVHTYICTHKNIYVPPLSILTVVIISKTRNSTTIGKFLN